MNAYLISSLESQWKQDPQSRVFIRLAEELRKAEEFEKAEAVCLEGLTIHKNTIPAMVCLGRCRLELKRFDEAQQVFREILDLNPDNFHALRGLARMAYLEEDYPEALRLFELVAITEPADEEVQERIAELDQLVRGSGASEMEGTTGSSESLHDKDGDEIDHEVKELLSPPLDDDPLMADVFGGSEKSTEITVELGPISLVRDPYSDSREIESGLVLGKNALASEEPVGQTDCHAMVDFSPDDFFQVSDSDGDSIDVPITEETEAGPHSELDAGKFDSVFGAGSAASFPSDRGNLSATTQSNSDLVQKKISALNGWLQRIKESAHVSKAGQ